MDLGSITAAVGGMKAAADLTKSLLDLKTISDVQSKVVELNTVIIAAQSSALAANSDQFALLERIRKLEGQVAKMEAWDSEKKRYKLTDFGCGTFAHSLQPGMENGEPPHRICPTCYEQGRKSPLQFVDHFRGREKVHCGSCNTDLMLGCDNGQPRQTKAITRRF